MTNFEKLEPEQYKDVVSLNIYDIAKKFPPIKPIVRWALGKKARDHARAPMQWSAKKGAGFTTGTPWMDINPNYVDINVEEALADPNSIWYFYQKINLFRRGNDVLREGDYTCYMPKDKRIWCYQRTLGDRRYVVVANYTDKDVRFRVPKEIAPFTSSTTLFHNYAEDISLADGVLRPYEAAAFEIK